jgi:hypothetical protein
VAELDELRPVAGEVLDGDGERLAADAFQVEGHHAHDRSSDVEERAAAEPRVRGARDDAAVEDVLPVRLELPEIGHEPPRDPPVGRTGRGDHEHRGAQHHVLGGREHGRGKAGRRHPEEREPAVEVLGDDPRVQPAAVGQGDAEPARAHHHVVDGEKEAGGLDHHGRPHALRAEDPRGGVRRRDPGGHVRGHREERLDEADGGVHAATRPRGGAAR